MVVASCRRRLWLTMLPLAAAVVAIPHVRAEDAVPRGVQSVGNVKAAAFPSYLDKSRAPDLVAARAAIDVPSGPTPIEAAELERQAEAKLMSESDVLARRAEKERALAAEVRAKAEALSQRFAEEMSHERKRPKAVAAAAAPIETASVGTAVQDERTAETMKRAADALARARTTLDEADRRVAAGKDGPVGTWEKVKAEFADARRKAAEAVDSAEKALVAVPAAVATIAGAGNAAGDAAKPGADPRKTLPPPYALGGTLR